MAGVNGLVLNGLHYMHCQTEDVGADCDRTRSEDMMRLAALSGKILGCGCVI